MVVKFFLRNGKKRDLNAVTSFYIDIIREALTRKGHFVQTVFSLSQINNGDTVFTTNLGMWAKVFFLKRHCTLLYWYQGIAPEEILLEQRNTPKAFLATFLERISLKYNTINFVVSDRMFEHFNNKYQAGLDLDNTFVMPCFNETLKQEAIRIPNRYNNPSFVYAGGLSEWQCISEMLDLFQSIQKDIPNARFTILTGEVEIATKMAEPYHLNNISFGYKTGQELEKALQQHKYGVLLRKDNLINSVATPTKMNTYLANGLIPIFTPAVDSFEKNINLGSATIKGDISTSINDIKEQIINFENSSFDLSEFSNSINGIFRFYYNRDYYIEKMASFLEKRL
ncbi:MAG: hypothetical protein PUJ95_07725 [Bacteroidales bacterium]|nr:hypothetical protein [Bacteroidales bacterium]